MKLKHSKALIDLLLYSFVDCTNFTTPIHAHKNQS